MSIHAFAGGAMVGFGRRSIPGVLGVALLFGACGTPSSSPTSGGSRSNGLTQEEMVDYATVLEAVQALRPAWLRERTPVVLAPRTGTAEANPVWVYWDGTRVGDASYLSRISPSQISRMIHHDAREASVRWGVGHENGVIYIVPAVGSAGPVFR